MENIHTRTEWAPMPATSATNAYDLLERVAQIVEEQPLRYHQGEWLVNRRYMNPENVSSDTTPECGTIGCVAGWIAALTHPNTGLLNYEGVGNHAAEVLGLTSEKAYRVLFAGDAIKEQYLEEHPEKSDWFGAELDEVLPSPGTAEYAKLGANHIRRYMAENKDALRNTPVEPLRANPA